MNIDELNELLDRVIVEIDSIEFWLIVIVIKLFGIHSQLKKLRNDLGNDDEQQDGKNIN